MSRKQLIIGLAVLVLLALGVAGYVAYGTMTDTPALAADGPGFTLVPTDRTMGNPKAKVTLIEYGAPSCPVCAHFNEASFPQVKANYIDTGKVFYVFRVFPLRADDGAAEKIARCQPEDKYFAFIDLLFRNQPLWDVEFSEQNPSLATPQGVRAGLVQLGRRAGMSAEQVNKCIDDKTDDDRINKVATDGETRYSITGTPTFVLDGTPVFVGNLPDYDQMAKALDTELARKK